MKFKKWKGDRLVRRTAAILLCEFVFVFAAPNLEHTDNSL